MQDNDELWFKQFVLSPEYAFMQNHPIVYFCAEYAINDSIPTYAGGLGILAGDIVREAAEEEIPLITVGLYYHEGYLHHDIDEKGVVIKSSPRINPSSVGLTRVVDAQNNPVIVTIPIQNTKVYIQAWFLQCGNVRSYFLDTNVPQNDEDSKKITDRLYASSKEIRFKQEMVLGLGGLRMLEALQFSPVGYHLNEGHSALLVLEIVRREMQLHKRSFQEELDNAKQHIFFSNHTLVAAGNDNFNSDLASTLLIGFAKEIQIPVSEIIKLGLITESNIFSMTKLALRMAGKINAVSRLHAQKAKDIWKDYSMIPITNGINVKTWDNTMNKENMWEKHQKNKMNLLGYISSVTGELLEANTLLLGWARRIVGYKRPLLLLENLKEFKEIACSQDMPIRVVISGLAHEDDTEGLEILEQIQKIVTEDLKGIVIYLPDYSMSLAKMLVSGCDVWLNTPVVGFEACGTSGMKAALNGVLPLSSADGWVAEANLYDLGWLIKDENASSDILSILKNQIAPLYYSKNSSGISEKWISMMQNARDMILNQFNAKIMLKKYIEEFYIPDIRIHETREGNIS